MSSANSPAGSATRVAIACQGGGSHTAFTAGVLKRLLPAAERDGYRVVGLSGTSGGAVCALLAWYALCDDDPGRAAALLEKFWADNAATGLPEQVANAWMVWASTLQDVGLLPVASPYDSPFSIVALEEFRHMLTRQVDFGRIDVDREGVHPLLLIGAVDVLSGEFRTFQSRRDRITADSVLASAAIPNLFRTVHVDGGSYWDGLFSQNPPVRELLDADPDELWVVQINPKERDSEPRTVVDIADRRNELSGNLSLYQELSFIEKIDQLLVEGLLDPGGKYRQVRVRIIELSRARLPRSLGTASKLDRDPRFLRDLIDHGEEQATEFLTARSFERAWVDRDADAVLSSFADDARLIAGGPFPPGEYRGAQLRRFVEDRLVGEVRMDPTRKQVARDRVTWSLRERADGPTASVSERPPRRASAEAEFRDGQIIRLLVGG
jgi:NTE family protein